MGTDLLGVRLETLADRLRVGLALLDLDGKGLAEALTEAGLTTDPNTVSAWLRGQVNKPAPDKMAKIAEWLGVSPAALATGAGFLSIGESAGRTPLGGGQGLVRLSVAETEAIAKDLSLLASRLYAATRPGSAGVPAPGRDAGRESDEAAATREIAAHAELVHKGGKRRSVRRESGG